MLNNYSEIGSDLILSSIIEKSGMTIQEVSEKTNIPRSRFSEWLNGKRIAKWNTLQEIATAINVKIKVEVTSNIKL